MGGPIARVAQGVASLGMSEAFQEKPFQDMTEEDRPTKGSGGMSRLFGVGGQAIGAAIGQSGSVGEDMSDSLGTNREVNAARGRNMVDADNAAAKVVADQKTADEFERSPQADAERRKRAKVSQPAGGYRKRPSQQLTDTLSGVSR